MAAKQPAPTAYELLGAHPSAPGELVSTCYWAVVGLLQAERAQRQDVETLLHHLTRSYQQLTDPERRATYNASIGYAETPLMQRKLPRLRKSLRSRILRRAAPAHGLDYYEVMGLDGAALDSVMPEAYRIMRDQYLRLPPGSTTRATLMTVLDESHAVLTVPERRLEYDRATGRRPEEKAKPARRAKKAQVPPPAEKTPPQPAVATGAVTAKAPKQSRATEKAPKAAAATAAGSPRDEATDAGNGSVAEATSEAGAPTPGALGAMVGSLRRILVRSGETGKPEAASNGGGTEQPATSPAPRAGQEEEDVEAVLLNRIASSVGEHEGAEPPV